MTGGALTNRVSRRAGGGLAREAAVLFGLVAAVVIVAYLAYGRSNAASPWAVAGTHVQSVSRSRGIQTQAAVAVRPSHPDVLFGAANDSLEPRLRVFSSADGGRSWLVRSGPALDPATCAWGDPSVAIAPDGRQYLAFTVKPECTRGSSLTLQLVVASRSAAGERWTVRRVAPPVGQFGFDDKPAIAVGSDGRAYVAWSRLVSEDAQTTVVSSSADGGRTWSTPRVVDRRLVQPQLVTVAAGSPGVLYVAGVDARGLWVGRSTDGGRRFAVRSAGPLPGNRAATCIASGNFVGPQQARRCTGPNPTLSLARDRVYLTYGTIGADGTQDAAVAVFDPELKLLSRGPVGPAEKGADQFWPASTVDAATGRLWACFYDTTGDPDRRRAWFVCTSSADGRSWTKPVRAGERAAESAVLWNDALVLGFGDTTAFGGAVGVAAAGGAVYPVWIDTLAAGNQEEAFAARIQAS